MLKTRYDVIIIGSGHNGLVAANYLAQAGLSVLILERNERIGGATQSAYPFAGHEAKLSVYSYLISLLPPKIIRDLGLKLQLRSRRIASYTPSLSSPQWQELLVSNKSAMVTEDSFLALPGGKEEYQGYQHLQTLQSELASVLWPTLWSPLESSTNLRSRLSRDGGTAWDAWDAFVENPLGEILEKQLRSDLVRGVVMTDAKIGVSTHAHDTSLLQNKTFLYHILGQGTGEWQVPVGGMGQLTAALETAAQERGVTLLTHAEVTAVHTDNQTVTIESQHPDGNHTIDARFLLCNAAPPVLARLRRQTTPAPRTIDEGSVVKINFLLNRLPKIRSPKVRSEDAFCGTFHLDEGYAQMEENYRQSQAGTLATQPAGEMYCHSLTDNSILSSSLNAAGCHTLTLFGLDMPYNFFAGQNEPLRATVLERYLEGINRYTEEPIQDCVAQDANGAPCIEIKTPVDLEQELHLPQGNIFHNALTWPFAENSDKVGTWGVETDAANIHICGSGARRGGAVSGIPGHNAAMKVLSTLKQ